MDGRWWSGEVTDKQDEKREIPHGNNGLQPETSVQVHVTLTEIQIVTHGSICRYVYIYVG